MIFKKAQFKYKEASFYLKAKYLHVSAKQLQGVTTYLGD